MGLISRYPVFVWAGAALLGWIGGEMIASDPWVAARIGPTAGSWHLPAAATGAALVVLASMLVRRRRSTAALSG